MHKHGIKILESVRPEIWTSRLKILARMSCVGFRNQELETLALMQKLVSDEYLEVVHETEDPLYLITDKGIKMLSQI